ncbi:MAG TPA: ribosome silencing factor [Ruminococcaceae bacterium]|jgi:ribosome-associated protein|nr:ribosome silencing factor [Oscillospiraceae bacterium]
MESRDLAKQAVISLDKHKAEDIRIIGIRDITVIADYFVIATGTSSTQAKALADYLETELAEQGVKPQRIEGYSSANWILMDYGSMIVHIFYKETRDFYNLERLWKDGQQLELSDFLDAASQDE